MRPPTLQCSSRLLLLALILRSSQSLKLLQCPTSAGRLSFNSLGAGALSMSQTFSPREFVAEENVNFCKNVSANEGVNADDKTVNTSN
jgi:hypothetical protein